MALFVSALIEDCLPVHPELAGPDSFPGTCGFRVQNPAGREPTEPHTRHEFPVHLVFATHHTTARRKPPEPGMRAAPADGYVT